MDTHDNPVPNLGNLTPAAKPRGMGGLVFFGGVHADFAVGACGVVPVAPLRRRDLDVVDGFPMPLLAHDFGFVEEVECLGKRVVAGVCLRAHRSDGITINEGLPLADRPVTHTPIRMTDQALQFTSVAPALPDRHFQRVQGEVGVQTDRGGPSEDPSRVDAGDERDVHPS